MIRFKKSAFIFLILISSVFKSDFVFAAQTPPPGFKALCLSQEQEQRFLQGGKLTARNYKALAAPDFGGYTCSDGRKPGFYKATPEVGGRKCLKAAQGDKYWCLEDVTIVPFKDMTCDGPLSSLFYLGCVGLAEDGSSSSSSSSSAATRTPTPTVRPAASTFGSLYSSQSSSSSTPTRTPTPTVRPAAPAFGSLYSSQSSSSSTATKTPIPTPVLTRTPTPTPTRAPTPAAAFVAPTWRVPTGAPSHEQFHTAVQYFFTLQGRVLDETLYARKMREYETLAASSAVQGKVPSLTAYDFYAIFTYSSLANAYATINNALRQGNKTELAKFRPVTYWLDHYISHAGPIGTYRPVGTLKLSRFVSFPTNSPLYKQYTIGALVSDPAYTSATADPRKMIESGNAIFTQSNIHLLIRPLGYKETKGTPLFQKLTDFGSSESEVLFLGGTKFKVRQRTEPGSSSLCSEITGTTSKRCVELDEQR